MIMETKIEIISINTTLSIHFIYVPEDYSISKLNLENHKTKVIGRLKQFNRVELLSTWKKDNGNLVELFTKLLEKRGWDFKEFPNPIAYAAYLTI